MAINSTQATAFKDAIIALIEGHDTAPDDLVIIRDAVTQGLLVLGCTLKKYSMDQVGPSYDGYEDLTADLAACKAEISTILGI